MGLTRLSECDNVELTAVLLEPILFPIEYMWNISFSKESPYMTEEQIDTANEYFQQFSDYATEVGVTLTNHLFAKDCELSVILYARTQGSESPPTSVSVTVSILADVPKAKFTNKANGIQEVSGDMPTDIPIIIGNKQCTKTSNESRLLQTTGLSPIEVTFQLFSGTTAKPTSRGPAEIAIETKLNDMYAQYQSLALNISQGFKFQTNYKIIMTVVDLNTNNSNFDELLFFFAKPSIIATIDPVGNLVSIKKDVVLNGANSVIPEASDDKIAYSWKCEYAQSYSKTSSCICPVLTNTQLRLAKLIIPKTKMASMCYYIFSLSVSALSSNKKKRVGSDSVDFLGFPGTVSPVMGTITKGTSNKINDMYFSFALTDSPVPDSNLTYNWTLVEITGNEINTTTNYTEVNTYIFNFLASMNIIGDANKKKKDRPIPENKKPKIITSTVTRVLGVDADTLIPKAQYAFGVKIIYPDNPSFALVYFKVPQLPRSRVFTVFPLNGTGMKTQFSLMFSLPKSTGKDTAQYQIYRRDCPGSGNPASQITQIIPTSSCYTTVLSAGQKSCKFQVEVILRALEYDDYKEVNTVITVVADDNTSSTDLVSGQLNGLQKNKKYLTPNQLISSLNELTNVPVPEASTAGEGSVNSTLGFLAGIDKPDGGMRDLMDDSKVPGLLNTTTSTMGKMLNTQTANVKPEAAGNMSDKMSTYLSDSGGIEGGSNIIPSCVGTLSGVAGVGAATESNSSFYGGVQNAIGQSAEMKLKEAQPGAPSYSVSTKSIEVVASSNYADSFNTPQKTASEKGNEMNLPGGLADSIMGTIANTSGKSNNTATVATSMNTVAYNPFTNVKSSSSLNLSALANSSTSGVSAEQIGKMYSDLSKGNLEGVNKKEQDQSILQIAFKPFQVQKNGTTKNTSSSLDMALPPGKNVEMGFPSNSDDNSTNSTSNTTAKAGSNSTSNSSAASKDLAIPMWYNSETKKWVNEGCKLIESASSKKLVASCDRITPPKPKIPDIKNVGAALSITLDLIKNVLSVIAGGNYDMLFNFGAFANAPIECYLILVCVVFVLVMIGYLAVYFHKTDQWPIFEERIITLYDMFEPEIEEEPTGILHSVYGFFSAIKKTGIANTAKKEGNESMNKIKADPENEKIIVLPEHAEYKALTPFEIRRLKALFDDYNEHCLLMSNKDLFLLFNDEVSKLKILTRLTHARRLDDLSRKPQTLCSLLKVRLNV